MVRNAVPRVYAAMTVTALIWGFIGIFTRNLSDAGFTAMDVSFLRMSISVAVLLVVLLIFDRADLRIRKKDIWVFVLIGIFKMLSDYFLFEAQIRIHLSLSTVLQLTSPFWVLFYSMLLFGEHISRRKIFAVLLALIGCILATGVLEEGLEPDTAGILFALMSGFAFATYTVGNKVLLGRGYKPDTTLVYVLLFATLSCVPFIDPMDLAGKIDSWYVVENILMISIVVTLIPYYLQTFSTKYLSAVTVILLALLEVLAATLVGYFYYGETLTAANLAGLVLIPLSIVVMNVNPRQIRLELNARR